MKQRGTDVKVARQLILQVEAQQGFALKREERLVFECYAYALAGVDNSLIGNGDDTHGVVDGIVRVLGKGNAACGDNNRASRHIHGVEPNLRAARGLIFAAEYEFVLVGELACHHQRGVIELRIAVLLGKYRVADFFGKVAAEWFRYRKDYLACGRIDGIAVDKVEKAVGI